MCILPPTFQLAYRGTGALRYIGHVQELLAYWNSSLSLSLPKIEGKKPHFFLPPDQCCQGIDEVASRHLSSLPPTARGKSARWGTDVVGDASRGRQCWSGTSVPLSLHAEGGCGLCDRRWKPRPLSRTSTSTVGVPTNIASVNLVMGLL